MKNDDRLDIDYLEDILNAIAAIEGYTNNKDYELFKNDNMLHDAVIYNIAVIGEASGKISKDLQQKHPEIPWYAIISMRNRLIHGYFGVDLRRIWLVIQNDIPGLKPIITALKTEIETY